MYPASIDELTAINISFLEVRIEKLMLLNCVLYKLADLAKGLSIRALVGFFDSLIELTVDNMMSTETIRCMSEAVPACIHHSR